MAGEHETPRPYRPHDGVTLVGPFWTRRQVAARLGITATDVRDHRTLLRIEGTLSVEEVYPSFQFDDGGIRREATFLARLLKRRLTDTEACDWLLRPRRRLDNRTPLAWLAADGDVDRVVRALPAPSRPIPGEASVRLGVDGVGMDAEADPGLPRSAVTPAPASPIVQ